MSAPLLFIFFCQLCECLRDIIHQHRFLKMKWNLDTWCGHSPLHFRGSERGQRTVLYSPGAMTHRHEFTESERVLSWNQAQTASSRGRMGTRWDASWQTKEALTAGAVSVIPPFNSLEYMDKKIIGKIFLWTITRQAGGMFPKTFINPLFHISIW